MKSNKTYIFILIGIFLISFTSATINIHGNINRPEFNLELRECQVDETPLFDNTDYYFQCFVGGYGYGGGIMSAASHEMSVKTNSTHRCVNLSNFLSNYELYNFTREITGAGYQGIHCRYSFNRSFLDWGGEGYLPASWTNNESTNAAPYWMSRLGNPGQYCNRDMKYISLSDYILINNDSLKCSGSYQTGRYEYHPEIAIAKKSRDNLIKSGFNVTQGMIWIEIDGDENWDNLLESLRESEFSGIYSISMKGALQFMGGISCESGDTFTVEKNSLTQMFSDIECSGFKFEKGSQYNIELGGTRWWSSNFQISDSSINLPGVATGILDNIVGSNVFLTSEIVTHYNSFDGWTLNEGQGGYHFMPYWDGGEISSNNVFNSRYEYDTPNSASNGIYYAYFINNTYNNYGKENFDFRVYLGYNAGNVNNWVFREMINTVSDRPNKKLIVDYYGNYPDFFTNNNTINFTFYFDTRFKITDSIGNEIENANITLNNGDEIYNGLTNSDGYLMFTPISYKIYPYYSGSSSTTGLYDIKSDYNLTITKEGYADYNAKLNVTEKMDLKISLESRDWNYSNDLKWIIRNETNTHLKLDELGNLAISGVVYENTNSSFINSIPNTAFRINDYLAITKTGALYLLGELMEEII